MLPVEHRLRRGDFLGWAFGSRFRLGDCLGRLPGRQLRLGDCLGHLSAGRLQLGYPVRLRWRIDRLGWTHDRRGRHRECSRVGRPGCVVGLLLRGGGRDRVGSDPQKRVGGQGMVRARGFFSGGGPRSLSGVGWPAAGQQPTNNVGIGLSGRSSGVVILRDRAFRQPGRECDFPRLSLYRSLCVGTLPSSAGIRRAAVSLLAGVYGRLVGCGDVQFRCRPRFRFHGRRQHALVCRRGPRASSSHLCRLWLVRGHSSSLV